jgi:hypothetical protein
MKERFRDRRLPHDGTLIQQETRQIDAAKLLNNTGNHGVEKFICTKTSVANTPKPEFFGFQPGHSIVLFDPLDLALKYVLRPTEFRRDKRATSLVYFVIVDLFY